MMNRVTVILCLFVSTSAWCQTLEDRLTAIINSMTMQEKILQLHQEGGFNTADNTRLGIPGFVMADGPHGVRDGRATSFPVGIGMAAMWDVDCARRIGIAMGKEFRGKGKHQGLGPCLDIDRDPRNGRTPETGGEDPYLCAQIASAVVEGMQTLPLVATIKHYNANHRENGRTSNNIIASQRVLHEHAGLAFRTAVQRGGALAVMNAYNLINGQKCAENPNLLTTILRTEWGFPYYVVSDWGSIWSSENAIKAGCDICMGSDNYRNDLPGLVANGTVPESVIDGAVRRVLRTKAMVGLLDFQPPGDNADVNSPAHQQLCLEAARKSLVLLKNQGGILPVSKNIPGHVALIGPNANVLQVDGSGSAYVTPYYTVTPRQGIEQLIGAGKVQYAKGCDVNSSDTSGFAGAIAAASGADAVIFCGGLDGSQEGEGFDRAGGSIDLPGRQQDLIIRLAAANARLIVVLFSGGVCGVERSFSSIRGLLQAFYPGQEAGRAVAEALFGDVNPGGKLPVSYPLNDAQLPFWNDNLDDDLGGGYRWYDGMGITPLFAFGYGLSYTTFGYSNLRISPASVAAGEPVTISVDVKNTGSRTGDEVVQLYLSRPVSPVSQVSKELKSFTRIPLQPDETSTVSFVLSADELYYFNEGTSHYDIEAGTFTVRVGGASDNLSLSGTFEVRSSPRRPDLLVTRVRMVPPYPLPGQKVVFLAEVKNQGSAATVPGTVLKVNFRVNGSLVSWSDEFSGSIPPAGMALMCGNSGPGAVNTWIAGAEGVYSIEAVVDPDGAIDECVESNNTTTAQLTVFTPPQANLALYKPVTVTSVEASGLEGKYAVDGNMGTRWSSAFSDPQTIMVDLRALHTVDDIVLYWEAAYAKEYYLRVSGVGGAWTDILHETNGGGGMVKIPVGMTVQRVMMTGVQRGTPYGYSLYEIQVHGSPASAVADRSGEVVPRDVVLEECYPNPFNPSTTIRYGLPRRGHVALFLYNPLGQLVERLVDGEVDAGFHAVMFDASGLSTGLYLLRMRVDGYLGTRKLLLVR